MQTGQSSETIAAIATAEGSAGVAVVRISGPRAWEVARRVVRGGAVAGPDARAGRFCHARFADPESGAILDDGLVLWFRGPASFTGEDVVELQGHGSPVLSRGVLRAVCQAGARVAEPGEFTRRAFLNGKLDLTQAEAVMDLVQAQTGRAARAARAQLAGQLGAQIADFYGQMTALGADVAAQLDFEADELPPQLRDAVRQRGLRLQGALEQLLQTGREGELLRAGARVVIGGAPNAGKSSLLNALVGTDRAIVSPTAGTTRDTIEGGVVLHGIPLRIMDTAGLREAKSAVEREGVVRAHQALQQADLILYLIDGSRTLSRQHPRLWLQALGTPVPPLLLIETKSDLPPARATAQDGALRDELARWGAPIRISTRTGAGLAGLRQAMAERLQLRPDDPPHATVAERHRLELECALAALREAERHLAGEPTGLVLAALELRRGAEALGRILGRTYSQDLLDQIFLQFCIGK